MTIIDCYGFGREHTELSQDYKSFLPRKRLEIFTPDSLVDVIFDTIMEVAYSGHHGHGKAYIANVFEGGRISTGEKDHDLR